ncbi:hypothetical protein EAF00_006690 [Botryotinia globosa]|nr:hypothetical protein EAF00_006690 [Botryotinia globosa]
MSALVVLEPQDLNRDSAFKKALHGQTGQADRSFINLMHKDKNAQKLAVDQYFKRWDNKVAKDETSLDRDARRKDYATLTRHYSDLATDLYEYGWSQSFHFCRFTPGESLKLSSRATRALSGPKNGSPARPAGARRRMRRWGARAGNRQIHRLQNRRVEHEIFRVLKPGGAFGVYEWLMTEKYDNDDPQHRALRLGIEQGNGISNMEKISVAPQAMQKAGFVLELHMNVADLEGGDAIPWYWPLSGDLRYMQSIWELPTLLRMSPVGRTVVHSFIGALETFGLAPQGTQKTADSLATGADCLVARAKEKPFTPMYLMVGRKPAV